MRNSRRFLRTAAVVLSMVSVLILDYFVTAVLVALGIT